MGGAGILAALETIPTNTTPFRSAVVFYPGCGNAKIWNTKVPVLLLLGGADDIAAPETCRNFAAALPNEKFVEVHEYADARHGFDVEEAPSVMSTGRGTTVSYSEAASKAAWSRALVFMKSYSK